MFGEGVVFSRGTLAEVTPGQEFGDQNGLNNRRVGVEGHELEDEAGLSKWEEGEDFAVQILARALHVLGGVDHFRLAFLQVIATKF